MGQADIKKQLKDFSKQWKDRGYEKGETQPFWLQLLSILRGSDATDFIQFENQVHLDHTSFMDGYIEATHVLVEQKSLGKDLSAPIKQSDGSFLNPFQQAKRYASELPYSMRPRWIVTCNFSDFFVYDMENPNAEAQKIRLADLEKEYYRLGFLVETGKEHLERELQISKDAGELVGKLYDAFYEQYKAVREPTEGDLKSLNILCVRLVFCLYAEDAGLFGHHDAFRDYMMSFETNHMREALINLFKVLDTQEEKRDPFMDQALLAFPYVNGGLFSEENVIVPQFTEHIRRILRQSSDFDWNDISPTIFGAVFESTLNPETRRSGGMHYTSIENIHKVIDPLFLNDLKEELVKIRGIANQKKKKNALQAFQQKLGSLTFLDPAAGSGNFLTETYLSLRHLENIALREQLSDQVAIDTGLAEMKYVYVDLSQFYGIEINDFAVAVARTALWIAECQMLEETNSILYGLDLEFLPLKSFDGIHEGNALRMDWSEVIEKQRLYYIIGNPPFNGARYQTKDQKNDIIDTCVDLNGRTVDKAGFIDYVGGWYYKAAEFIQSTTIRCAFVSTNSITQGEQVAIIWKPLFEQYGIGIDFAYRTFVWNSEAVDQAHVHCVIIGFSINGQSDKWIFDGDSISAATHINGYLLNAPDCYIRRLTKPICSVPRITNGNRAYDGNNLVLTRDEKDELLQKEPAVEPYIREYYMGADLMKGDPRYVLWLVECPPNVLKSMPQVMKRVEAVKKMRLESSNKSTIKAADTPALFQMICQPNKDYLAFPRVSSQRRRYIPMTFLSRDCICGDKLIILPDGEMYHFGILMSNIHNAWMRVTAGRLKSDYSYSSSVYNNFPWPDPTDDQKMKIERTAQAILDARALYPDASLADLYDELTMPPELRKAHQANDKAVWEAYGKAWDIRSESDCVAYLMKRYQELTEKDEGR